MAVRYRELQRPSLIETGNFNTGGSETATRLAQTFKAFENTAAEIGTAIQSRRGQQEGAEAGASGQPEFRRGFTSMTAYSEAYNNSALRSYAIKSEADADEVAARLEVEAGTDPDKFALTFGSVRDSTLKSAPPEARGVLQDIYTQRLGQGLSRIQAARADEVLKESRATTSEGILRATDKVAQLRASDDPALSDQADEEQAKLNLLIDGARNDGTISEVEATALYRDSQRSITKQTVLARFDKELQSPYGSPVDFIERLKEINKASDVLPPDEEDKLGDALLARLREHNALLSAKASGEAAEIRARYDAGERNATEDLLAGRLTQRKLLQLVHDDNIDPAVARTLLNELQSGADRVDDAQERFHVETSVLDFSEQEIRDNPRLSWETKRVLVEKRRNLATGWRGTQQAREGADRIDRSLGIIPGVDTRLLSESDRRARDQALTEWYDTVDALPEPERQSKAIDLSQSVIDKVIRSNARTEISRLEQRLRAYQTDKDPSKLKGAALKEYESTVSRYQRQIEEARRRSQ